MADARWVAAREKWVCWRCGKPVRGKAGGLEIAGGMVGGYPNDEPRRARDEHVIKKAMADGGGARSLAELEDALSAAGPAMSMRWIHYACFEEADRQGYCIDANRCETANEMLDWIVHLSGKVWMGTSEIRQLVLAWGKRLP